MSAPVEGAFTCAALQEIKALADKKFAPDGGVRAAEYVADVEPILMIQEIQTAQFQELADPNKDNTVRVIYMDDCDTDAPEACDTDCDVDGPEIGLQCQDYELDLCFQKSFSVKERKYRGLQNVTMEEEISTNLLKKMKLLDEEVARYAVSRLNSWVGVNANTSPYPVSGTNTVIPSTAWNEDLFGYFYHTMKLNRMPNMKLFLGGLMNQTIWKIQMGASTPEGAVAARKIGSLGKVYTDLFITESELSTKKAFLVNPSSVAFVSKAYFSPYGAGRPMNGSNGARQIWYTMPSYNIPGVVYDVVYQEECASNDVKHSWKITFNGGLFRNPNGCSDNRTGVLGFTCA